MSTKRAKVTVDKINISCPHCDHKVQRRDDLYGMTARWSLSEVENNITIVCAKCGEYVWVKLPKTVKLCP